MIQQFNSNDIPRLGKPVCDLNIMLTGTGIPAGMIVDQDNGGRGLFDSREYDFPWMYDAWVQAPLRNGQFLEQL